MQLTMNSKVNFSFHNYNVIIIDLWPDLVEHKTVPIILQGFIQGGGGPGISPPQPHPSPPRKFRKLCNYIVTCDNTIVIIEILSV